MRPIFRKVNCHERQPKKTGQYIIEFLNDKSEDEMTKAWYFNEPVGMNDIGWAINVDVDYWLEEIKLPNDREILKKYSTSDGMFEWEEKIEGAKWMRDFVLAVVPK